MSSQRKYSMDTPAIRRVLQSPCYMLGLGSGCLAALFMQSKTTDETISVTDYSYGLVSFASLSLNNPATSPLMAAWLLTGIAADAMGNGTERFPAVKAGYRVGRTLRPIPTPNNE